MLLFFDFVLFFACLVSELRLFSVLDFEVCFVFFFCLEGEKGLKIVALFM